MHIFVWNEHNRDAKEKTAVVHIRVYGRTCVCVCFGNSPISLIWNTRHTAQLKDASVISVFIFLSLSLSLLHAHPHTDTCP